MIINGKHEKIVYRNLIMRIELLTGWWIEVRDCGKEATEREGVWLRGRNVRYRE